MKESKVDTNIAVLIVIIPYELIRVYRGSNIQCYVQVWHISLFWQFHQQLKILSDCLGVGNLKLSEIQFYFFFILYGSNLTLDLETGIEAEY